MRAFVNFGGILLIILILVLAVAAYYFFKNSDPDNLEKDPDADPEELKKERKTGILPDALKAKEKRVDEQETVLTNMPVLSWKYPGGNWETKELSRIHTTIGRGEECDIVIHHPTVSVKHAEIIMKLRKINARKKGARYFLLKNHSRENPISFLNAEGSPDDWRDIVGSIPFTYSENAFFLGLVEMRLTFPANKHVLSEGPDFSAHREQTAAGKTETGEQTEAKSEAKSDQEMKGEENQEQNIADPELIRVQRKVIRRSPRSRNRI